MSFWDKVKNLTQPYSDEEYDDYEDEVDDYEEEAPRRTRRAAAPQAESSGFSYEAPVSTPNTSSPKSSGFNGHVVGASNKPSVVLFRPTNFESASKAADDLRDKKAIIVNMENLDKVLARRVLDFMTGCAYALYGAAGEPYEIADSTYLFCPNSMDVIGTLKDVQNEEASYV